MYRHSAKLLPANAAKRVPTPETRTGDKSVSALARSLGLSQSCLSNWIRQADIEEGHVEGLSAGEKKELAELRRRARRLELENEILKRAAGNSLVRTCSQNKVLAGP